MELYNSLPRGIVASAYLGSDYVTPSLSSQGEVGIAEVSFVQEAGRSYKVVFNGTHLAGANSNRAVALFRLRYTNTGASPVVGTSSMADSAWIETTPLEAITCPPMMPQGTWGPAGSTVRVLLTWERFYGTGSLNLKNYAGQQWQKPIRLYVEDVGPDVPETWVFNYGGNDYTSAAPPPPPAKKTYTTTWKSTSSGTYKDTGAKRTNTTDVVQGDSGFDTNGNNRGLWIFPNTITSTLSGSTISKIEVYAYANHWYNSSGGTAYIKVHGYTSAPASSPTLTTATSSSGWPKPGGRWVTLPTSMHAGFLSGAYKGFGMGPGASSSQAYYGRFNGGTGAQIRITYVK
jgi:hypothetical protein